jgi:hypothetical protein
MRSQIYSVAILCLSCVSTARAQSNADNLASFTFEGTQLGCTFEEFRQQWPNAEKLTAAHEFYGDPPLMRNEITKYRVTPANTDLARFCFYQGRLYEIKIWYGRETLENLGGEQVFDDRLTAVFGRMTNTFVWESETHCARVYLEGGPRELVVYSKEVKQEIKAANAAKAAEKSTGF